MRTIDVDREPQLRTCRLCGSMSADVHWVVVKLRRGRQPYVPMNRCADAAGCRDRVEASHRHWLVDDGTPGSRRSRL